MSDYSNTPESLPSIPPQVSPNEASEHLAIAWEIRPNRQQGKLVGWLVRVNCPYVCPRGVHTHGIPLSDSLDVPHHRQAHCLKGEINNGYLIVIPRDLVNDVQHLGKVAS